MSDAVKPSEPRDVPTFSECVVGFRAWRADTENRLWPLHSTRRPWSPGVNTARCNCGTSNSLRFEWAWHEGRRVLEPAPEHEAPDSDCVCGLYSLRHPRKAWFDTPAWNASRHVVGAVASWGHIQVHSAGLRAEHACVVSLAYHPDTAPDGLQALERIAERYRVELVPLVELELAASRHGTPLPESMHPVRHGDVPHEHPTPNGESQSAFDTTMILGKARAASSPADEPMRQTHRLRAYTLSALLGVAALAIGVLSLLHPVSGWAFGEAHRSDAPPIWGVGFLTVPIVLVGIAIWQAWWTITIDIEAWRRRRRRRLPNSKPLHGNR